MGCCQGTESPEYKSNSNKSNPIIDSNGTQKWYKEGNLHRDDGPAIIWSDGTQRWYIDGRFCREDGPAVITRFSIENPNGTQY